MSVQLNSLKWFNILMEAPNGNDQLFSWQELKKMASEAKIRGYYKLNSDGLRGKLGLQPAPIRRPKSIPVTLTEKDGGGEVLNFHSAYKAGIVTKVTCALILYKARRGQLLEFDGKKYEVSIG